jgi:1,2-phenylacetyl-CoA epoxidase catalytic subunit
LRARRALPWKSFVRSKYPEGALQVASLSQRALARGEYSAVDLFAHMTVDLSLCGAPFDLTSACVKAASDEMRHADYAIRLASLFAGETLSLELDREGLSKAVSKRLSLEELDVQMLEIGVMSETLAAALLSECARGARDPLAKALFSSLVSDEVHHARLGWYYMAWRSPQWSRAEKQRIADHAGEILVHTERQFWKGRDAPKGCEEAARALGVMGSGTQREVVRAVVEEEIVPGLDALGLGASHAWAVRQRGG